MGSGPHDTCLFASMSALASFDQHVAVLDTEILSVKSSYYATTHRTTFRAERNDCVHLTYFSFHTSVLHT